MNSIFAGTIAVAALLAAPAMANVTYDAFESFDGATVALSITTDGATGVLSTSDITNWNIDITDTSGNFDLNPGNSQVEDLGLDLSATSTHLIFDFSSTGFLLFESTVLHDSGPFWCATGGAADCWNQVTEGIGVSTEFGDTAIENEVRTDRNIIATAVPEPATWALMLGGFAMIGGMLRRRAQPLRT
jgi:hypothetical protein